MAEAASVGVASAARATSAGVRSSQARARASALRIHGVWLLAVLLAVPSGAIAALRGFDGLYGQDAYAYFDYSVLSVRQSLMHVMPLEPFFWPPGYPLLVATTSFVLGPSPLAGQFVSLLMGALVPVLAAFLVRELWPEETGMALLAGGVVALCGQLWQSSVVVMADTTGLALATFTGWSVARFARTSHSRWLVAASAAIAWATLARWIYGLVAVPLALFAISFLIKSRREARSIIPGISAAIAVAAVILARTVGPSLVGLFAHPDQPAAFVGNFQVYSWSPINAFLRDFDTADGHLSYALPNGAYYAIAPTNFAYFGPLLVPWLLAGLWAARRWSRPVLMLVLGWAAIVYAFHAGAPWQNFRFALAYLPPLAVVVSAGVLEIWRELNDGRTRAVVAVLLTAGLLTQGVGAVRLVESFIDRKDHELALVKWVQAQARTNAELFTFGPTLAFRYYSNLPTFDLFELHGQAELDPILGSPSPHYALVDEASLAGQWQGQAPETNFELLRDGPGLTRLGGQDGYTLFRVGS